MWRKCDQFQPGTNFAAWMMRIAYLQTQSYRRKLARSEVFVEDEEFLSTLAEEAAEVMPDGDLHDRRQEALRRCIDTLPNRQRQLVKLRYSTGGSIQSIKSIADQMGMTATAVKQALYRARTMLIACVEFRMKEVGQ